MRHVTNEERRTRLGVRHALVPSSRVGFAEAAADSVVALHATDPATVYVSYWARSEAPQAADLERALNQDRSLVKQLAMRRTLFVFPRELLAATWASASARVAHAEEARIAKAIMAAGVARDGHKWVREVRSQVLAVLAVHPQGLVAQELRELVPALRVDVPSSSRSVVSQVLTYLGAMRTSFEAANRETGVRRKRSGQSRNAGLVPCPLHGRQQRAIESWFGVGCSALVQARKTISSGGLAQRRALFVQLCWTLRRWRFRWTVAVGAGCCRTILTRRRLRNRG